MLNLNLKRIMQKNFTNEAWYNEEMYFSIRIKFYFYFSLIKAL